MPDLEATLKHPDVVHSNNFWCPLQLRESRLVYTFYDLGFVANPDWTTEANRAGCFQGVFRASLNADLIVAISDASRRHYLKVFPHFPEERIQVIYPASRFATARLKPTPPAALDPALSGRFWLAVGTIEPRKNQLRLAQAYAQYRERVASPMPLVLAGGAGWLMEDFALKLAEVGVAEHVIMTGYISDDELAWLYGNCHVNLYPSLFEGFGMPVLEAMTFGAATIAADTSSIPEAAGDAAVLIDPLDTAAWTEAMVSLSAQPERRAALGAAALRHARRFSWEASARDLLQAYQDACAMPRREFA
jgi:glycosyltransferase involved in cell wall biosynthesis